MLINKREHGTRMGRKAVKGEFLNTILMGTWNLTLRVCGSQCGGHTAAECPTQRQSDLPRLWRKPLKVNLFGLLGDWLVCTKVSRAKSIWECHGRDRFWYSENKFV